MDKTRFVSTLSVRNSPVSNFSLAHRRMVVKKGERIDCLKVSGVSPGLAGRRVLDERHPFHGVPIDVFDNDNDDEPSTLSSVAALFDG